MTDRKEDIIQNLGKALFLVFFFLVCASVSGSSEKLTYNDAQYEVVTGLHSSQVKAIIAEFIQMPVYQKSLLTSIDKSGFTYCNIKFKLSAENRNIVQHILFVEKTSLSLKPLSYSRFYYHFFPTNTWELPALS